MRLSLTPSITINQSELSETFIRSPGPGGQNVNKVSTAVQLRFDITGSPSLSPYIKERLIKQAGRRVSKEGVLIITANRSRSQEQNRADAFERLKGLTAEASVRQKKRKATKPTRASKQNRLAGKAQRSGVKKLRRTPGAEE